MHVMNIERQIPLNDFCGLFQKRGTSFFTPQGFFGQSCGIAIGRQRRCPHHARHHTQQQVPAGPRDPAPSSPSSKDWERQGQETQPPAGKTGRGWGRQAQETQHPAGKTGRGSGERPSPQWRQFHLMMVPGAGTPVKTAGSSEHH